MSFVLKKKFIKNLSCDQEFESREFEDILKVEVSKIWNRFRNETTIEILIQTYAEILLPQIRTRGNRKVKSPEASFFFETEKSKTITGMYKMLFNFG